MVLMLRNGNGTPDDYDDDDFVYLYNTLDAPAVGDGWVTFQFDIPSSFVGAPGEMPANWTGGYSADFMNLRDGVSWHDVLSNIDSVEFWFGEPGMMYLFEPWEVGADNLTIEWEGGTVSTAHMSLDGIKAMYSN